MRLMSPYSPYVKTFGYWGFGHDSSTDTYKVVNVWENDSLVNVYNMGDNCWRRIRVPPSPDLQFIEPAVCVSNSVIWLAFGENLAKSGMYSIVSFDLRKQKFAQLSLPHCPPSTEKYRNFVPIIGVLRGCLCISENNKITGNFVVWQMKKFGVHESWTQLLCINVSGKIIRWPCRAMGISDNGDALLLSTSAMYRAVLYTLRDNKLE